MKKIDGINLEELTKHASAERQKQSEEAIIALITKKLIEVEAIVSEIQRDEKSLEKKREKLKKVQDKFDKIKAGDWSALSDGNEKKNDN